MIRASAISADITDQALLRGLERVVAAMTFPPTESGVVTVSYPFVFRSGDGEAEPVLTAAPETRRINVPSPAREEQAEAKKPTTPALSGKLATVMRAIGAGKAAEALAIARAWHRRTPGDVLALIGLGEACEATGARAEAARAYGSIIDLFPWRADLRRFAGARLERVGANGALALALDSYEKARKQRPDHPSSHRLLAFALLKQRKPAKAFAVLSEALARRYPGGRFAGVERILREDLGLAAAAWMRAEPGRRDEIADKLEAAGGAVENKPSLRFVLTWETDANDVDLHIHDASGGHAYYSEPRLPSGGLLYDDVTTGYGPECFTVRQPPESRSARYRLRAHYYSRGPMGYGMGKVQVIDHDGRGTLRFDERPFVVMNDQAYVELGEVRPRRAASEKVAARN